MKVIERDGKLYVKEYAGAKVICFWPITYTAAEFAQRYGADRYTRLLHELVSDMSLPSDNYDFVTHDGIILPVPNGGATKPAWTERIDGGAL